MPAAPSTSALEMVCTESTTSRSGSGGLDLAEDGREIGLRGKVQRAGHRLDPLGAGPHLRGRLLTADVEHAPVLPGGPGGDVEQQGGLADARLAGDEDDRARDQATTEDSIELRDPRRPRPRTSGVDLADGDRRPVHGSGRGRRGHDGVDLAHRAPCLALAAPTDPLDRRPPALGAPVPRGPSCLRTHGRNSRCRHRHRGRARAATRESFRARRVVPHAPTLTIVSSRQSEHPRRRVRGARSHQSSPRAPSRRCRQRGDT